MSNKLRNTVIAAVAAFDIGGVGIGIAALAKECRSQPESGVVSAPSVRTHESVKRALEIPVEAKDSSPVTSDETDAERVFTEQEVAVDSIVANLTERSDSPYIAVAESYDQVFVNDGSRRSTIDVEEPNCPPDMSCDYAANVTVFTEREVQGSFYAAGDCILHPDDPEKCNRDAIYPKGNQFSVTSDSPDNLANQVGAGIEDVQ